MKIKYLEWSKDAGEYIGDFVVKTNDELRKIFIQSIDKIMEKKISETKGK